MIITITFGWRLFLAHVLYASSRLLSFAADLDKAENQPGLVAFMRMTANVCQRKSHVVRMTIGTESHINLPGAATRLIMKPNAGLLLIKMS